MRQRLRLPSVVPSALPWALLAASGAAFVVGAWSVARVAGVLTLGGVLLAAGVASAFVLGSSAE